MAQRNKPSDSLAPIMDWTDKDGERYNAIWKKVMDDHPVSEEEKDEFAALMVKRHSCMSKDPGVQHLKKYLGKALSLVDDLCADGADLSSHDRAQLVCMLTSAGEEMVSQFTLFKKCGRRQMTPAP